MVRAKGPGWEAKGEMNKKRGKADELSAAAERLRKQAEEAVAAARKAADDAEAFKESLGCVRSTQSVDVTWCSQRCSS